MNEVFGLAYADSYDTLYSDKNYSAECNLIERIFHNHGESQILTVLDLGCGTGSHAFLLAERGYEIVGVDRSKEMLARAREKAAPLGMKRKTVFHEGDVCSVDLKQTFDAALMMFAVLGYQVENAEVLAALATARKHLRPGGPFIFDFWYGPAVLHEKPSERAKVIKTAQGRILRIASGALETRRHLCRVDYHVWELVGDRVLSETQEVHRMRYFFPLELELLLQNSGFALVRLGAFPEFSSDPDETTWNVLAVARAV